MPEKTPLLLSADALELSGRMEHESDPGRVNAALELMIDILEKQAPPDQWAICGMIMTSMLMGCPAKDRIKYCGAVVWVAVMQMHRANAALAEAPAAGHA
jgi:hypothetical protein